MNMRFVLVSTILSLLTACSGLPHKPLQRNDTTPTIAPPLGLIAAQEKASVALRLIGEQIIPHRLMIQNTPVGGLSGIDYDAQADIFYLISEDPSGLGPVRFYTARIRFNEQRFDRLEILGVTALSPPAGGHFARAPSLATASPESVRFDPLTQSLIWTSKGEKKPGRIVQPFVRKAKLDGSYDDQLTIPEMFSFRSDHQGLRNNLSLDGLSLSPDAKTLWLANADSLFQDGPISSLNQGGISRFTQFDRQARRSVAQYAYILEPIPRAPEPINDFAENNISEILAISENRFLVIERAFANGKGFSVKLFEASIEGASDVQNFSSLNLTSPNATSFTPLKKRLVADLDNFPLKRVDNIEGLSFGPTLPNGHRTLIMVSDDNFNPQQVTQLIAFEIIPSK